MRIYLVRHGKASRDAQYTVDADRPLTKRGKADAERIAVQMARAGVEVQQIRHSGLLRAQQTAEIFGKHLKPPDKVIAVAGLHYDDPPEQLAAELVHEPAPVMFVGHNPFMERVVSQLLTGSPNQIPAVFPTSGTVCMEYGAGVWSLRWMLTPEVVPEVK